MPLAQSPDDFCRLCRGKGYLVEAHAYGHTCTETCWNCKGTGYGR